MENAIKELEDQIEKIHTKRRALRTVMNENHDQLISKFPPEIASQIFNHYAPQDRCFGPDDPNPPLYLGAVCRKWRQLAWGTPQLWTSLFISLYAPQLLAEYLERSANLPLAIGLYPSQKPIEDEIYLEAINILNKHSSRWNILHSSLPARHLHRLCGSPEENILLQLILRPDLEESTEHRDAYDIATFSMKCKPSPTHLTLATYRLANVDILWNYLTSVSMEYLAVDECFELMRRAPLLEVLSLYEIIRSSTVFPIPAERIILPQLHSLGIVNTKDGTVVLKILDLICAPSLKRWDQRLSRDPSFPNNMVSFIGHSSFSLKSFIVGGSHDRYDQLHNVLDHLSSLESLNLRFHFRNQSPTNGLINRLCASDEFSPFLPRLRTLEFSPQLTFPWESLPRLFSTSTRQSLTVKVDQRTNAHIPDETAEKLLELVDAGFNLSILRDGKVDVLEEYREKRRLSYQ